jgi:hypothetical protein
MDVNRDDIIQKEEFISKFPVSIEKVMFMAAVDTFNVFDNFGKNGEFDSFDNYFE